MASILDLNSASSDSEDDGDYVPPTNVDSDESGEESCDEVSDEDAPAAKKMKGEENSKKDEPSVSTDDKKSTEEVWKNFLKGVESTSYGKLNETNREKQNNNDVSQVKEMPIQDNKTDSSKVITETKLVSSTSKSPCTSETSPKENENKSNGDTSQPSKLIASDKTNSTTTTDKTADVKIGRGRTSIASVLGAISGKDKKMSVLEKSLHDWKKFKQQENIEEDLQTFNKGKQGFIERQRFLQRSDLRLFETEKSARLGSKRK